MKCITVFTLLFCIINLPSFSQEICGDPGTTSANAIPVCGTTPFVQPEVANCTGRNVATRGCNAGVSSSRSFWYKFTCYQTGSFGFLIRGITASDDYDWVLYDITGRNPADVFTDASLQISMNLYGTTDNTPFTNSPTGCSPAGTRDINCEGDVNNSPFNRMPTLNAGREYLLMVANYSNSTSGYDLTFIGGTASITDPLVPSMNRSSAACNARQLRIKLNKKIKCSSVAANGSDFTVNVPGVNVIAAAGIGCTNGFDTDSILITTNIALPIGTHRISIRAGTDNNTLLDYCDKPVPAGNNIPVEVAPIVPTPIDSLTKPGCAPRSLQLIFRKPMMCSSIAANGSDFSVSGPGAVTITGAAGTCTSAGLSASITITLAGAIQLGGNYTLTLQTGSDGNSLLDECEQQTPVGSFINFTIADTVNADFNYNIVYGCVENRVQYTHNTANGVNNWQWTFDGVRTSSAQNPLINYTDYRQKNTTLVVSNGVCKDTSSAGIVFDNFMEAAFEGPEFVCPDESVKFVNQSEGNITSYEWSFGNGVVDGSRNPPSQTYLVPITTRDETVRLITRNSYGCADTALHKIKVVNNCYIAVPSAFTPNNDGLNDYLYPLNAYKAKDLTFSVYNRFGQRMFFTRNWLEKWDGKFNGQGADPGTYVWILQYTHTDTNQKTEQKGTVILIR